MISRSDISDSDQTGKGCVFYFKKHYFDLFVFRNMTKIVNAHTS